MVELAIQEYDDFVVSCLEFDRGGISYTYDTINFMQELWPDAEIYLIIGEDALIHLYKWYRMQDLLRLVHFVAAKRSGYEGAAGVAQLVRAYGPWAAEKVIHALLHRNPATAAGRKTHPGHGVPGSGKVYL